MDSFVFDLQLPAYEVLRFYEGRVATVRVRAHDGRMVEFLFEHLLPYATRQGVSGTFVMFVDDNLNFAGLQRIE